jgi:D-glycero-D-manno-heptose 1,7-bisphosphate phosphatase
MVTPARPAVFLDRDGVLVESFVRDGKPYAPTRLEDFVIIAESRDALARLKKANFMLVVVTNQPDVGNGLVERSVAERMNERLRAELPVDAIKTCFHAQTAGCDCRKPAPGLLIEAARELDIDHARSYMVGDRWSDIDAGYAAGCSTVFIDRGYDPPRTIQPDFTVRSLIEAADRILKGRFNA